VGVLEDLVIFCKQISMPVFSNANGRFANLKRLLEAICLRRTKALLSQPEPVTETRLLQLSAEESVQYDDYAEGCKHAIDLAVSGHSVKKANQHVIQAILGMRLFCNDGERALTRRKHAHGLPTEPEEALSLFQTSADAVCIECNCEITAMYQGDDESSGILTTCQHLMCGGCRPQFEADLDDRLENGRSQCPFCGLQAEISPFIVTPSVMEEDVSKAEAPYYPTKLRALLDNVRNQSATDKWWETCIVCEHTSITSRTCSIVFSFWKTTLDIVASILDVNSLPYYRIHGSLPASKRSKILTEFEHSTSTRTLLITLGTGAVGYDLALQAVANLRFN
jgi:SWI/SNF-related matrix-associated actin-dependent regulator of chromatin subfamily A3